MSKIVTQLRGSSDVNAIEAPVTVKAYLMCVFASFGGIFFGYDSGYINGVTGSRVFIDLVENGERESLAAGNLTLITSILSAGTFFGAIIAGDVADRIGRRPTIIVGCIIYTIGVIIQIIESSGLALICAGRAVAGIGVGFVSAVIILYMSEICPRKVRGALVSGYQFCITLGLLTASVVNYAVRNRTDSGSYRIPIGIQFAWGLILGTGLFFLPESPRYFVKKGNVEKARGVLARLRGQPADSEYVEVELAEIVANADYERQMNPYTSYVSS